MSKHFEVGDWVVRRPDGKAQRVTGTDSTAIGQSESETPAVAFPKNGKPDKCPCCLEPYEQSLTIAYLRTPSSVEAQGSREEIEALNNAANAIERGDHRPGNPEAR